MELPSLQPIWEKYRDRGLAIVAVESKRQTKKARKMIEEKGLTYHFLENGEGDENVAVKRYRIFAYPSSFIIDREGRILYYHLGFDKGDEVRIEEEIVSLLEG